METLTLDQPVSHARQYGNTSRSTVLSVSSIGTNHGSPHTHGVARATTTNNTISGLGLTGPTTRSRKRKHNNNNTSLSAEIPSPPYIQSSIRQSQSHHASTLSSPSSKRNRSKKARGCDCRNMSTPGRKKAPAGFKSGGDDTTDEKPVAAVTANVENCCICMSDVEPNDLASIDGCDHRFCFGCIEKWSERENKCPLCKVRFTKIDRVHKKKKKGTRNTIKVKDCDQRSDLVPGAALDGLLANLNRNTGNLARIILGGFDFGVGFGGTMSTSGPGGSISSIRSSFATRSGSRVGFDLEHSDEDESPMSQFMRAIHGGPGPTGLRMSTTVVRPVSVTARFTTTSRSFARNVHDSTAGNNAENPLEIEDDGIEEIIEID